MVASSAETSGGDARGAPRARRAARLAAVQALYEIEIGGGGVDAVVEQFWPRFGTEMLGGQSGPEIDRAFFSALVRGVVERRAELDRLIAGALQRDLTLERMELLMRAVLRTGAFEILARPDVPPRVAIAEHVGVSHAFFGERETGLVNGVLDRLARTLRAAEMEAPADDPAPR